MSQLTLDQIQAIQSRADCLHSVEMVESALDRMATEISQQLADQNPLVLCVLNGAVIPTGKLLSRLSFPLRLDSIHATRYRGTTRGGELQWLQPPTLPLANETLLIIDDILDEGITLAGIVDYCQQQGAQRVVTAVLVEKLLAKRPSDFQADIIGLQVPDRYVFGYGMDYKGYLRNANGIFAISASDMD